LSFHWDAFDIEIMVEEKMTSSNFDGGCRHLALGPSSLGRWGYQALGARARPARLAIDLGARVCTPQARKPKRSGVCRTAC